MNILYMNKPFIINIMKNKFCNLNGLYGIKKSMGYVNLTTKKKLLRASYT